MAAFTAGHQQYPGWYSNEAWGWTQPRTAAPSLRDSTLDILNSCAIEPERLATAWYVESGGRKERAEEITAAVRSSLAQVS